MCDNAQPAGRYFLYHRRQNFSIGNDDCQVISS